MPTEARGGPKQPSSLRRYSGAAGTLGNHRETATPEGTSAALLLLVVAKQEGGPGLQNSVFVFLKGGHRQVFFCFFGIFLIGNVLICITF